MGQRRKEDLQLIDRSFFFPRSHLEESDSQITLDFPTAETLDRGHLSRLSRVHPLDSARKRSQGDDNFRVRGSWRTTPLSGSRATSLRVEESQGNANVRFIRGCQERKRVRV